MVLRFVYLDLWSLGLKQRLSSPAPERFVSIQSIHDRDINLTILFQVVTVEYNSLTYNYSSSHSFIRTVSGSEFSAFYLNEASSFDIALSVSSFDHDGLGRYGDPLNPDGDIEAMGKVLSILKPGGLLFLTVPVGPDVVVFNLHRRYGPVRLPALLNLLPTDEDALFPADVRSTCSCIVISNAEVSTCASTSAASCPSVLSYSSNKWHLLEKIGWNAGRLTQEANWRQTYEPVFVLQKQALTPLA